MIHDLNPIQYPQYRLIVSHGQVLKLEQGPVSREKKEEVDNLNF